MTVGAILNGARDLVSVTPDMRVDAVVKLLAEARIGAVPVLEEGAVAGMFSERDVIACLAAGDAAALTGPVGAVMTSPAVTVAPDTSVLAALSLMTRRRIRHLPVVADGRVLGLVSIGDLVKFRIERIEADAAAMRDYIQSA